MSHFRIEKGDPLEKAAVEYFEWVLMDSELLKTEYFQGRISNGSEQIENFCKSIIGFDMVASEIVRITSAFELNYKFKDNDLSDMK